MKKMTMMMALLLGTPAVWAQDEGVKSGLPADVYITCAGAQTLAKEDSVYIADVLAVMGNASVSSRSLKLKESPDLAAQVVEKLNQECTADPQMLLVTAMDNTMRKLAQ